MNAMPQTRAALLEAAQRHYQPSPAADAPARVVRRGPRTRQLAIGGGTTALAATIVGVVLLVSAGSSPTLAHAFPVFTEPAHDIRAQRSRLEGFARRGADLQQARAITTAYGTGYVTTSTDGTEICVAVPPAPDSVDAGYVGGCAQASQAGQAGLFVLISSSSSVEFTAVLPASAGDLAAHNADGTTTPLTSQDGVTSAVERSATTVTFDLNGAPAGSVLATPTPPGCALCRTPMVSVASASGTLDGGIVVSPTAPAGSTASTGTTGQTAAPATSGHS